MKIKRQILFLGFLTALLLSGCSFVRIQNVSDRTVYVNVNVPDSGKAYTRIVGSGEIVDVFSSHGGRYTVTIMPNERYETFLKNMQQQISTRLFEEGATLTAEEVARLTQSLNDIDQFLAELALPGATCSGQLPDYDTAVAVVAFDFSVESYAVSCNSLDE